MSALETLYMVILNPFYKLTASISEKSRKIILYITFFSMISTLLVWYSHPVTDILPNRRIESIIIAAHFFVIILFSVNQKLQHVKWNKIPLIFFFGFIVVMLITRLIHPIGGGWLEMLLLSAAGFPCLYFVWHNREDYGTLYKIAALAATHAFLIYLLITLVLFPTNVATEFGTRYVGMTNNPNLMGQLAVSASVGALYLIATRSRFYGIYVLELGLISFFLMETESRTTTLVLIAQIIIMAVYCIVSLLNKELAKQEFLKITISVIVVIVICAGALPYINNQINPPEEVVAVQVTKETVPEPEQSDLAKSKLNKISSGRIVIWAEYISHLNLTGNDGRESLYIDDLGRPFKAHNTVLDIAYRSGVIAGFLFLMLELYMLWYAVKSLLVKRKTQDYWLYMAMAVSTYIVISMFEIPVFFYNNIPTLFFYLGIAPVFGADNIASLNKRGETK